MNIVKVEHLLKYDLCITLAKLPRAASHIGNGLRRLGPPPITVVSPGMASGIRRCSIIPERDVKLLV